MLLTEISNLQPLSYKWISSAACKFEWGNQLFGIIIEKAGNVSLGQNTLSVGNILFGTIVNRNLPLSDNNLNTNLTGLGNPRLVLSTVVDACINNPKLRMLDMIVVGAGGDSKLKRFNIYSTILNEIKDKIPEYQYSYNKTLNSGSYLLAICKVPLSSDDLIKLDEIIISKS
jgi:hypothetical protein